MSIDDDPELEISPKTKANLKISNRVIIFFNWTITVTFINMLTSLTGIKQQYTY